MGQAQGLGRTHNTSVSSELRLGSDVSQILLIKSEISLSHKLFHN
jgi:hypothetical protein